MTGKQSHEMTAQDCSIWSDKTSFCSHFSSHLPQLPMFCFGSTWICTPRGKKKKSALGVSAAIYSKHGLHTQPRTGSPADIQHAGGHLGSVAKVCTTPFQCSCLIASIDTSHSRGRRTPLSIASQTPELNPHLLASTGMLKEPGTNAPSEIP